MSRYLTDLARLDVDRLRRSLERARHDLQQRALNSLLLRTARRALDARRLGKRGCFFGFRLFRASCPQLGDMVA